jgi:hypothetical protein
MRDGHDVGLAVFRRLFLPACTFPVPAPYRRQSGYGRSEAYCPHCRQAVSRKGSSGKNPHYPAVCRRGDGMALGPELRRAQVTLYRAAYDLRS